MEHSNKSQYLQAANWHSRETENLEQKKKNPLSSIFLSH